MKTILLIAATCLLYGCCPKVTTEYITRADSVRYVTQMQTDTVLIARADTAWIGESVKYILRVDTLFKKVFVSRKSDTVYVRYTDTTAIIHKELPSEPSWLERQIWKLLIFGALFVGLIVAFRKAIK